MFWSHIHIDSITVMIQREVADTRHAPARDYGALSLGGAILFKPVCCGICSGQIVLFRGLHGSSVIRLDIYKDKPIKTVDEKADVSNYSRRFQPKKKDFGKLTGKF